MTNELDHLMPSELLDGLPDPTDLKRVIKERLQQAYADLYKARGDVLRAEDTYELHRRLQATRERVEDYARGFADVAKLIGQLQQEELVEAVGEQDGVPLSGLTIPTAGGDIVVKPSFKRTNDIDPAKVRTAIIEGIADAWQGPISNAVGIEPEKVPSDLREMLEQALTTLEGTGKWEPQVSKLKATAAEWARSGRDDMAAKLTEAHTIRQVYQDKVDVTRKTPK